ncbi:Aste57867_19181 [Aphanomyces stellatus]|uniref:Aste57867_19181 protein n=1 Tax=Aphanomyces stellatus TaxID=120398 RepID=A0A485LDE7_9STRA|nr:hypothetical protein As57867_019117 [Aphanomyces stellatus]VFT95903.1 Aste57867_19181 [Aphanomyces stellatus]
MVESPKKKNRLRNKAVVESNIIYVNGIPLSKDIVDDPSNNDAPVEEQEAFLDAEEMFKKYDRDNSGGIDLDEFKVLLKDLNLEVPEGKTIVYFRKCDLSQKGFISFEEFRIALFTCDPANPARTGGFCPGKSLTPKDLFSMFDADDSGEMGVLKFMKLKMSLDKMESLFSQLENPDTEALDYKSFRKIWLSLVDVRKELNNRSISYNKLLPKSVLAKKLEAILDKEDAQEQFTMDEAKWNIQWERLRAEREKLVQAAQRFADYVLGDALDAAGQVYVFGKGSFNRFDGMPASRDFVECPHFETLLTMWTNRLRGADVWSPLPQHIKIQKTAGWESPKKHKEQIQLEKQAALAKAKSLDVIETQQLAFQNRLVAVNTAWLWARRIKHISCGTTVAYALTDTGELYCWGGSQRRWNYLYTQSDESLPLESRPFTARTEQLKLVGPAQVRRDKRNHNQSYVRKVFHDNAPPKTVEMPSDDRRKGMVAILDYFNLWGTSPPNPDIAMDKALEIIEFDLNADLAANAIRLRGLRVNPAGKAAIVDDLSHILLLEIECMGATFHQRMKRTDAKYVLALHNNNTKLVTELLKKGASTWRGMRKLVHALEDEVTTTFQTQQAKWDAKRDEIRRLRQKQERIGRESVEPVIALDQDKTVEMSGLTTRGPPLKTFQGKQALHEVSIGAKHALAVHVSGKLYGWGFGTYGRLGNGTHDDMPVPKPMTHLQDMRFRAVACGYSHSLALRADGQVFVWGSAATGKLGLESDTNHRSMPVLRPSTTPVGHRDSPAKQPDCLAECFTIVPLPLQIPAKVKKIACGPSHSAAITTNGELFVWGCGDGGRLGLGDGRFLDTDNELKGGRLGMLTTPTKVTSIKDHVLVDVSCGISHTAVVSAVKAVDAMLTGGVLFVCGSAHSLGKFCPAFTTPPELKGIPMVNVSCGNAHTAAVSVEGELYTWGNNTGGCTGHTMGHRFVKVPTKLPCFYQIPQNMARNKLYEVKALQSSVNSGYSASFALDGNTDGQFESTCTQTFREICPFWQVDLGVNCRLDSIRIWNRKATDAERLFPCFVMISEKPFEPESGKFVLRNCRAHSIFIKFKLEDATNPLVWRVPENTLGRYVRIQLDSTNILSLAQVEVLGVEEWKFLGAKASSVACGDDVTMVICKPQAHQAEIDKKYLRALCANIAYVNILREYPTFGPCVDTFTDLRGRFTPCLLCTAQRMCPICVLFEQIPKDGLPPDFRATHSLNKVSDFLLTTPPPRTFALPTTVATDDEKRLLQIAVDDEKPESDLAKAEALVVSTMLKAAKTIQTNPTVQKMQKQAAGQLEKIQANGGTSAAMSKSFLKKAMASSKESWQKYTTKREKLPSLSKDVQQPDTPSSPHDRRLAAASEDPKVASVTVPTSQSPDTTTTDPANHLSTISTEPVVETPTTE